MIHTRALLCFAGNNFMGKIDSQIFSFLENSITENVNYKSIVVANICMVIYACSVFKYKKIERNFSERDTNLFII